MAHTWVHGRAEACHGAWDKELVSPGLASEVVITGIFRHLNPLRPVPGPWGNLSVCSTLCVLEGSLGEGEGRSQLLVRPNLILLMILKVDIIFISVLKQWQNLDSDEFS